MYESFFFEWSTMATNEFCSKIKPTVKASHEKLNFNIPVRLAFYEQFL